LLPTAHAYLDQGSVGRRGRNDSPFSVECNSGSVHPDRQTQVCNGFCADGSALEKCQTRLNEKKRTATYRMRPPYGDTLTCFSFYRWATEEVHQQPCRSSSATSCRFESNQACRVARSRRGLDHALWRYLRLFGRTCSHPLASLSTTIQVRCGQHQQESDPSRTWDYRVVISRANRLWSVATLLIAGRIQRNSADFEVIGWPSLGGAGSAT
jgi:hypothetical protein